MRSFEDLNPIAVSVYFLFVTFISMFTMDIFLIVISLFGALTYFFSRNGLSNPKAHLFPLILFVITALLNPFISHNGATVLFVLNNNPVTFESFLYGLSMAIMLTGVLYWFKLFSDIMTSDKLIYVFGALSPKIALMLSLSLRYVPYFTTQIKKVKAAQTALGLYKDDNIIDRIKGSVRIFSVMVTWVLENGIITADSMTARGYGIGKRSRFSIFSWKPWDVLLLILSCAFAFVSLLCLRNASFSYYPYFELPVLNAVTVTGYLFYLALSLLPTIIHAKEAAKWRFLRSKI